jgi:nucleotide-binding universal stress UspA family protein
MATKILVTTDLSKNSEAGIKFAVQLASQNGSTLIFYHIMELLKPTHWHNERFKEFSTQEIAIAKNNLQKLIARIYRQTGVKMGKHEFVVQLSSTPDKAIIKYAKERKVNFICMSTRGAGLIRRIVGTYTSSVIKRSPIPVLVIPQHYKRMPITHVLYASDFNNVTAELKPVKTFTGSVKSKLTVLNYDYLSQEKEVQQKFDTVARKNKAPRTSFYLQKFNLEYSLSTHIKKAIEKFKPSIVILFTEQKRDWFDRLFLSSKSAEVSFDTKKPLLVYPKKS